MNESCKGPIPGRKYKNLSNGKVYAVTKLIPFKLMGVWVIAVIYVSATSGEEYGRTLDDFETRFVPHEE